MSRSAFLSALLALAACQPEVPVPPPADPLPDAPTAARTALGVSDAYLFAAPAGGTAGMFFTVDAGPDADTLLAVRSDVATKTDLHETVEADGLREMQPVAGVPVVGGGQVALEPGSYHVMLLETTRALAPGDTVDATAVFSSGRELPVRAVVRPLTEAPRADAPPE